MTARRTHRLIALIAALSLAAFDPVAASASATTTKSASHAGLTLVLAAHPVNAKVGRPVRFTARATTEHATGAFIYGLAYGDGTRTHPVAIPQYCLAGAGRPAAGAWTFRHTYRSPGHYRAVFTVAVNCSGEHAAVELPINVTRS